jgi:hypothetical protein
VTAVGHIEDEIHAAISVKRDGWRLDERRDEEGRKMLARRDLQCSEVLRATDSRSSKAAPSDPWPTAIARVAPGAEPCPDRETACSMSEPPLSILLLSDIRIVRPGPDTFARPAGCRRPGTSDPRWGRRGPRRPLTIGRPKEDIIVAAAERDHGILRIMPADGDLKHLGDSVALLAKQVEVLARAIPETQSLTPVHHDALNASNNVRKVASTAERISRAT